MIMYMDKEQITKNILTKINSISEYPYNNLLDINPQSKNDCLMVYLDNIKTFYQQITNLTKEEFSYLIENSNLKNVNKVNKNALIYFLNVCDNLKYTPNMQEDVIPLNITSFIIKNSRMNIIDVYNRSPLFYILEHTSRENSLNIKKHEIIEYIDKYNLSILDGFNNTIFGLCLKTNTSYLNGYFTDDELVQFFNNSNRKHVEDNFKSLQEFSNNEKILSLFEKYILLNEINTKTNVKNKSPKM